MQKPVTPRNNETWVLTDGAVGMEAQGSAVAEAVGLPVVFKRVVIAGALRLLPLRLQIHLPPRTLLRSVRTQDALTPPWPRLIVSVGRRPVPVALALKRLSGAYALHIQDPRVPAHHFDLIAAPAHDAFKAPNALMTLGAVHRVTAEKLSEARRRFATLLEPLPAPRIAVLLGGDSYAFAFPPEVAHEFGASLAALAREHNGSLLITPSRRTSPQAFAAFTQATAGVPRFTWEGHGENPYLAILAFADFIVATNDSVNMVTEAAGTGKPIYVKFLRGRSRRNAIFHQMMRDAGATRPLSDRLEAWVYTPINDTARVASVVRRELNLEPRSRQTPLMNDRLR